MRLLAIAAGALGLAAAAVAQQPGPTGAGPQGQAAAPAQPAGGPPPAPKPETRSSRPAATRGEALYLVHCAMCHGPNGMGTGLIGRRSQPALLEQRKLTAAFVITAARNGIGNMPAIPRGEVSDADLKAIADYLAAGPYGVPK